MDFARALRPPMEYRNVSDPAPCSAGAGSDTIPFASRSWIHKVPIGDKQTRHHYSCKDSRLRELASNGQLKDQLGLRISLFKWYTRFWTKNYKWCRWWFDGLLWQGVSGGEEIQVHDGICDWIRRLSCEWGSITAHDDAVIYRFGVHRHVCRRAKVNRAKHDFEGLKTYSGRNSTDGRQSRCPTPGREQSGDTALMSYRHQKIICWVRKWRSDFP